MQHYLDSNCAICKTGQVLNTKTGNFLTPFDNGKGYKKVILNINGKRKSKYVHRLVAETYIRKPRKRYCDQVNHKDGNKSNNHYTNLEWVTNGENQKHKYKMKQITELRKEIQKAEDDKERSASRKERAKLSNYIRQTKEKINKLRINP